MDACVFEEFMCDPSACGKLSLDQKRDLVLQLSKWPDVVSDMLHAWSRHEILQILCAELGKERKYTGLTKSKMIEHLLKVINEKKLGEPEISLENGERAPKRQRKLENSDHLLLTSAPHGDSSKVTYCKNSACKAIMNQKYVFCKRCSCCICHEYDDNKDPSLWLVCSSEPPFPAASCGMSCHLECALKHENSGISQDRQDKGLDGSFCCVFCGKVNDLLGSWRKQLIVARDTRRVDILCYRLCLAHKILSGTKHYQNLHAMISEAVDKLEEEVGPLTGLPVKKARGIVNRLSSGPAIQKLCASAMESLDSLLSARASDFIGTQCELVRFQGITASSVFVIVNYDLSEAKNFIGFSIWCRRAGEMEYPVDPARRLMRPNSRFLLDGLAPSTKYFLKAVPFGADTKTLFELQFETGSPQDEEQPPKMEPESPNTNYCSLSNPSSVEDDKSAPVSSSFADDDDHHPIQEKDPLENGEKMNARKGSNATALTGLECIPYVGHNSGTAALPVTPSKFEAVKNKKMVGSGLVAKNGGLLGCSSGGGSWKKRRNERGFEYYVKVIRWLECEGHIETSFRQKFLTWYSLRASDEEMRVARVFIDTFIEDPESLAGQLLDTFSDVVLSRASASAAAGLCIKLWH